MVQEQGSENVHQENTEASRIIPTVFSNNGSSVSDKEDVAIVLSQIYERVGLKQSGSRTRGVIFATPFIVMALVFAVMFGVDAEPTIEGILVASIFPLILAAPGLLVFFKLYKPDMKVVGVEKIYLTSHVTSRDLTFVFDGSAIQKETGFSYSDVPDEIIGDLRKTVNSIEEENGEEEREHSTRAKVKYIQSRLSEQSTMEAKGAIFPSNHPVLNLINRHKALFQNESPHGFKSFTGNYSAFDEALQTFEKISAIESRASTRDEFDKLRLEIRESIEPYVDQINVPYGKVTKFFDSTRSVEKERWFRGNDISFGEAQVEYSDIGYASGHHKLGKLKDLDKASLVYPVQAIIDNFERGVKAETDQLYESQSRQLTNLKSNLEREITRVQSNSERDINRLLTKADVAEQKASAAQSTYNNARRAYSEANKTNTDSKMVAASLANRQNTALRDSRKAENDIRTFTAEAEQSRKDAEESQQTMEKEIQDLKDSLDNQTKQNLDSLNKEISAKRNHIDRVYSARDRQLDKIRNFLEQNLTNEMIVHNEPFKQRLDSLENPRDSVGDELLERINELTNTLTSIDNYNTNLDLGESGTVHIPFWITFIQNNYDTECHLVGLTELQKDPEEGRTVSPEGMDISRQVIKRLSESNLLHKPLNLPISEYDTENSGNALPVTVDDIKETLDRLVDQGIINKGLGKKTSKYFSGKSVSTTSINDFLSQRYSTRSQRESTRFFLGDGKEFSDIASEEDPNPEDSTDSSKENDVISEEKKDGGFLQELKDEWDENWEEGKKEAMQKKNASQQHCTGCGASLQEQDQFCISCGQEVKKSE